MTTSPYDSTLFKAVLPFVDDRYGTAQDLLVVLKPFLNPDAQQTVTELLDEDPWRRAGD